MFVSTDLIKIGGQGFKSISNMSNEELSESCKELINKLKNYFKN